eukprot:3662804-Rhodomonas_salina.6
MSLWSSRCSRKIVAHTRIRLFSPGPRTPYEQHIAPELRLCEPWDPRVLSASARRRVEGAGKRADGTAPVSGGRAGQARGRQMS